MNLDEFVKKYNDKQVEVHGSADAMYQCVDLVNAYIRDVLKQPIVKWTHAKNFPSRIGDKYKNVVNTPMAIPEKGDIIVWDIGNYGHIAICLEADRHKFKSFDQNWNFTQRCKIEGHYYNNVAGWLRLKGVNMEYKGLDLSNRDSMKVAVDIWHAVIKEKLYVKAEEYVKLKDSSQKRIEQEEKRHSDFLQELSKMLGIAADEPKILENIAELLAAKEPVKKTKVVDSKHSKICGMLARVGL